MSANLVYIVDDDQAIRDSLSLLMQVKGIATECFDAAESFLARLQTPYPWGCVLLDVRMRGISGLQTLEIMSQRQIRLPVVIITGHGDVPMAVAALKAGADDFIEKPYNDGVLLRTVRFYLDKPKPEQGAASLPSPLAAMGPQFHDFVQRQSQLTPRERQVMDLVVTGLPNKVIAHQLGISIRTVEIHRANLMEKMQAKSLADLIRFATLLEISSS